MNTTLNLNCVAHALLKSFIPPGSWAVDATAGNGHDTLFLAQCCGPEGQVQAFDLQGEAVRATSIRLQEQGERGENLAPCMVRQASHAQMRDLLPPDWHGRVAAILFNLGYLPGSDKTVVTRPESTLAALEAAAEFLAAGGVLSVMAYPGHPGGEFETEQVLSWINALDIRKWEALHVASLQRANAPRLCLVRRRE